MKYNKVLIVEDLDSITNGIRKKDIFNDCEFVSSRYVDDALLKIEAANRNNAPFDLLITDLSFHKDHLDQTLKSGEDLILAINEKKISIDILIFSIENKVELVRRLTDYPQVKSFISKGRYSLSDLDKAIDNISRNKKFYSDGILNIINNKDDSSTLSDLEIALLKETSQGFTIQETHLKFKEMNIKPNGTSSLEKKMSNLKTKFKAKNNVQLISICKDMGII